MNPNFCPTCHTAIPDHAPGGFCPACLLRDADDSPTQVRLAPSVAEISAAFPQWEILALIGEGGMGFVYQIRQPALDRIVALKILSPELSRDPAFAERFAREARVLGKLNHPNIVTVYESGESGGFFYLVMEYVDGVNLRQAMRAGRFTPQQALAVVPGICDALQAAHAQGVWHRDVKPENILLDAQGNVKIVDFGIARLVGDPRRDFTLTRTGAALGSAAYMAPEQHEKPHDVDHRADIYSLGVVIYEMLTGELPLGRFPAPSAKAAVDARIDEIVFRTLEKEREMRQQSATEVKTDMQNAAVAPKLPTPSVIDFSSWKLVLAAVVFSYIGTAWDTPYGRDDVNGLTTVGLFSPWLRLYTNTTSGGHPIVLYFNSFSAIAMILAGVCWLRWFRRKRTRKQDLASFLLVKGPGFALKVTSMWVSAVAFFLWAWMAVTGLYLCLGALLIGRFDLDAPVREFLFAGIASGTVWTLFKTLHASSSFISSKTSDTTSDRQQKFLTPDHEKEREMRQQSATEVKTDMQNAAVAPKLPAPSVIDFSSWKLVLVAVVFSYIGTAWHTFTGADGMRSTLVGFAGCWLNDSSSFDDSYTRLELSPTYSLIAMFLAGACWLRWFWLKRVRVEQHASFLHVSGPHIFLKMSCVWISSVAFFLWAWMALTGIYLYFGRLVTDPNNLRVPVLKFLIAGIASGTVWTLFKTLHASSLFNFSKTSDSTHEKENVNRRQTVEEKPKKRYGKNVKLTLLGGVLLFLISLIVAEGTVQSFFLVVTSFVILWISLILILDVGDNVYDHTKAASLTVRSHRLFWLGLLMTITGLCQKRATRIAAYKFFSGLKLMIFPQELLFFLFLVGIIISFVGWCGMLRAIWKMYHHYISRKRAMITLFCLLLPFFLWSPIVRINVAMNRYIEDASDGIMGNEDWSSTSSDQVDMRNWLLGEWLLDGDASKHGVSNIPITKNLTDALAHVQASESGQMLLTITPKQISWTTKSETAWKPTQELRMENGSAIILLKLPDGLSSTMVRFDRHDENTLLITPLEGDRTSNGPVPRYTLVFKRKSFGNAEKNQESILEFKSVFGPVVERSLYFSDNMRAYLDFQSGESSRAQWALSAIPTDEAQKTWLKQTGVDAYAIEPITNKPDQSGVVVHEHPRLSSWSGGCVFALVPHSQSFDSPLAEDMEACLKDAADTQALMGGTYWFKTSDGAKGIVHLYGINDSPPQVQLRYRLFVANDVVKEVESWSYTLRHLDAQKLEQQMKASPQAGVTTKVEAGVVTVTGRPDVVRWAATFLRSIDQPEVKDPLQLPLFNMPPDFFTRLAMPVLMSGDEWKDSQFEPTFFETLKRENITAPQLARALRSHVLELEKATFVNTGTPFDSIVKTPGASTYYDATIPCSDQPDKPLTFRIRRTTQQIGTKPDIAGFAPWLIEEAKKQSKEPITASNQNAEQAEVKNVAARTLAQDAAMLAATKGKVWKSDELDMRRANGVQFQQILVLEFSPFTGQRENPPQASVKVASTSPTVKEGPITLSVGIGGADFSDVRLEDKEGVRTIKITQAIETVDHPTKKTERILNDYRSMSFEYILTADTLTLKGFPTDEITWGSIGFIAPTRDIVFKLQP